VTGYAYERAATPEQAVRRARQPGAAFVAGGTNLLDLIKVGVERPALLIDIGRLPLAGIEPAPDGGVVIGALARNSDVARHPLVRERYPLLSQALLAGASAQLRNMATMGGNLLQRTRCYYFYDPAFERCNKRAPGSGCAALDGINRIHAILGASEHCIAVNPSDMNVALAALRATIRIAGMDGERRIPVSDLHRLPGERPQQDTTLAPGELITAIELPPQGYAAHSCYLKVRERASYAFALVSVAAGLELRDGKVRSAALALGGVAHKPWQAEAAERALAGRGLDEAAIDEAAEAAVRGASPYAHNAYKIPLAQRAVARALRRAGGME